MVAHTLNQHQWIPGSEPYVVGLVAIDEQPSVRLTTNLVDVYIKRLREKIDANFEHKLLHTVRGSGYILKESP